MKKATISFKNKLIAKISTTLNDLNLFMDQSLQSETYEIRDDYHRFSN